MTQVVKISDEINPHLYDLWTTDKPYIVTMVSVVLSSQQLSVLNL
ncbi:hypothetical protein J2Z60_000331 [Lactobacillus colini]|uniref:Uncharacterized protein n=1 Tax=Lactobacillus colini TaxID=1819254 RepID=A0ABS4MCP4_9LACO|nr:hypothetical protein [Lactobacillus colini]